MVFAGHTGRVSENLAANAKRNSIPTWYNGLCSRSSRDDATMDKPKVGTEGR